MKAVIYQTYPILFDLRTNLDDIITKIHQGKDQGAQLIVFPELALTGYFVGQRYHELDPEIRFKGNSGVGIGHKRDSRCGGIYRRVPSHEFLQLRLSGGGW